MTGFDPAKSLERIASADDSMMLSGVLLVVRVHQEFLKAQKTRPKLVDKDIWDERLTDIARFEDYLTRQGVVILKFYLNLSRKEQKKRFMERLDKPDKNWKFSASDVRERRYWDGNMASLRSDQFHRSARSWRNLRV